MNRESEAKPPLIEKYICSGLILREQGWCNECKTCKRDEKNSSCVYYHEVPILVRDKTPIQQFL